jgi:Cys-rich protein (TIGR01571 family)
MGAGAEWSHGLCGCFDNLTVCIITYLAPCVTFGKNAEAMGENCLLYGLVYLVPLVDIFCAASIRGKIREQKGIEGSFIGDCLAHCFCPLCALSQDAQEVNSFGGSMAQSMVRE